MTDADKLKLAQIALVKVGRRIQAVKEISYHIGAGSSTFDAVAAALSLLEERPLAEIRDLLVSGASKIRHDTAEDILDRWKLGGGGL